MEVSGSIFIKFASEPNFDQNLRELMMEYGCGCVNDSSIFLDRARTIDLHTWHSSKILEIEFSNDTWLDYGTKIYTHGENVDFCMCSSTGYGLDQLVILTREGSKYCFSYEQGSELFYDPEYYDLLSGKYDKWKSLVPKDIEACISKRYYTDTEIYIVT